MSRDHKVTSYARLLGGINSVLENYRRDAAREIQILMEAAYLDIGRRLVAWELGSQKTAVERDQFLRTLADDLRLKSSGGLNYETLKKLRKYSREHKAE